MKTKTRMIIREAMQEVDTMKSTKPNCVRLNSRNTDAHELLKYLVCRQLNKEGKTFYTEIVFLNGQRADIFVPEDFKCIEILGTETREQCLEKTKDYPEAFEIVMVDSKRIKMLGKFKWDDKLIY